MVKTITATLILSDDDPPGCRLNVQLDGATLASRELAPVDVVAALGVIAPEAAGVWEPAQALVAGLQAAVEHGATAQAARESALAEWLAALGSSPLDPV
jgi:hypothetical protein